MRLARHGNAAWVVVHQFDLLDVTVVISPDRGDSWRQFTLPDPCAGTGSVLFSAADEVLVTVSCGPRISGAGESLPQVLASDDGGATWTAIGTFPDRNLVELVAMPGG